VKSSPRHAATAAGFLALSLIAAPLFAQARVPEQRGGPPGSDTPYILIATFKSPDRQLGVQMADELRKRLQSEHAAKELYVVPKNNINSTLEASGYRPDSALNTSDLMELAKQLRGEQVIDGTIARGASGVHVEARLLMRTGQQTVAQPLPVVDAKDASDAAKQIERSLGEASKSIPSYKQCANALRAAKYDDAVRFARAGLAAYQNSTISRLCLLSAYSLQKAPADSIIAVAKAITAVDPTSLIALANLADAYNQKGDTAKAIETNLAIYKLDPSNTTIAAGIVQQLAQSGAPDKALPIVDSLLKDNPGDPQMLRTKWLLLLRAGQFKQAIATGEEYVKADTAAATLEYFQRQIGAAQSDSNAAMVQQLAAKAAQRFPADASLQVLLAQNYRKSGQLQQALAAARRATEVDPKNANAWLFAIVTANDLNQPDTAKALAQKAIAAGVSKDQLGTALLGPASEAVKKAQASKARADWEAALKTAQEVDAIAPSPQSKFFIGVSSFQVAVDILGDVQKLAKSSKKDDQRAACTQAKQGEDLLATTSMAMPAGGSVDKNVAGQILGAVSQYSEFIGQVKKAFCK
jgi:tetratricopeptide (TPR) repeat protein